MAKENDKTLVILIRLEEQMKNIAHNIEEIKKDSKDLTERVTNLERDMHDYKLLKAHTRSFKEWLGRSWWQLVLLFLLFIDGAWAALDWFYKVGHK